MGSQNTTEDRGETPKVAHWEVEKMNDSSCKG